MDPLSMNFLRGVVSSPVKVCMETHGVQVESAKTLSMKAKVIITFWWISI